MLFGPVDTECGRLLLQNNEIMIAEDCDDANNLKFSNFYDCINEGNITSVREKIFCFRKKYFEANEL